MKTNQQFLEDEVFGRSRSISQMMIGLLTISLTLNLLQFSVNAQWNPDVPGTRESLPSKVLNENRDISVLLPDEYKAESDVRYDVIYVLDAEDDAKRIFEIVKYLGERQGFIPPCIVVNIWTMLKWDRDKDLTPTHIDDVPTSGGAAKFLSFLKDELIPFINSKYKTTGDNTLYGHSYGGLFSLFAFLSEPQIFEAYILADPSLFWDNRYMLKVAEQSFSNPAIAGKSIFIGGRDGLEHDKQGITAMDDVFRENAPTGLYWKSEAYPNETHFSLLHKTAYDGLKFAYSGYPGRQNLEIYPNKGIVTKSLPFPLLIDSRLPSNPPLRYTTDGTLPSLQSAELKAMNSITLSGPGIVTMKSFGFRKRHDNTAYLEFKFGEMFRATTKSATANQGGFSYSYFEGAWDRLPDFSRLEPVKTGHVNKDFDLQKLPKHSNFAILIQGYLEIAASGYYLFFLNSDDGSKLFVDDVLLIDHDGLHGPRESKSFMVPLENGFHSIRLEYFQQGGGAALQLRYTPPGADESVFIPTALQYSYN